MATLSRVYLRADRPERGPEALKKLADSLFESVDLESIEFGRRLKIETGTVVQVRVGSVEIIAIITTVALVIRDYPDYRDGLLTLIQDAREAGRWIRSRIVKQLRLEDKEIEASRVSTSHLMQLDQIITRVRGKPKSVHNAHKRAVDLFRRAGVEVSEELSQGLLTFFEDVARQPKKATSEPRRAPGAAAVSPRRRRVYRRGVRLERKPGEDKISGGDLF